LVHRFSPAIAGRRQSGYGVGIPYTMHDMTHEKMIVLMLS
jgi:hypothetical protein